MSIKLEDIQVTVGPEAKSLFRIPHLEINAGEKILIKGASGRGKTTFLHLLAGLFVPREGRVIVGDTVVSELSSEKRAQFRRSKIGLVFQKLNLIDHLTAIENIELAPLAHDSRKSALEALQSVGLKGREHDRTSVMSLGEQQRVAIARVLATKPDYIFADEPTSSLDEKNTFAITELLLKSAASKTLLVVSHDHRIEKFFERVLNFEDFAR